jgi:hypothetical protein
MLFPSPFPERCKKVQSPTPPTPGQLTKVPCRTVCPALRTEISCLCSCSSLFGHPSDIQQTHVAEALTMGDHGCAAFSALLTSMWLWPWLLSLHTLHSSWQPLTTPFPSVSVQLAHWGGCVHNGNETQSFHEHWEILEIAYTHGLPFFFPCHKEKSFWWNYQVAVILGTFVSGVWGGEEPASPLSLLDSPAHLTPLPYVFIPASNLLTSLALWGLQQPWSGPEGHLGSYPWGCLGFIQAQRPKSSQSLKMCDSPKWAVGTQHILGCSLGTNDEPDSGNQIGPQSLPL